MIIYCVKYYTDAPEARISLQSWFHQSYLVVMKYIAAITYLYHPLKSESWLINQSDQLAW